MHERGRVCESDVFRFYDALPAAQRVLTIYLQTADSMGYFKHVSGTLVLRSPPPDLVNHAREHRFGIGLHAGQISVTCGMTVKPTTVALT